MSNNWKIEGNYFESCTCDVVCPCIFLKSPTKGHCTALVGWAIEKGHLDNTDLAGLNVGIYLHAPGDLTDGGWRIALYIDDRASAEQKAALEKIYGGEVGGHPAVIASLVGEVMGVHSASIQIDYGAKEKSMVIKGVGEVKVHALEGAEGKYVTVENPPLAVAPGHAIAVHETDVMKYDHEEKHSHAGTVSLASAFTYQPD